MHMDEVHCEPLLLQAEQSQPRLFLYVRCSNLLAILVIFSLGSLQYVTVSPTLRSPELDTVLQAFGALYWSTVLEHYSPRLSRGQGFPSLTCCNTL